MDAAAIIGGVFDFAGQLVGGIFQVQNSTIIQDTTYAQGANISTAGQYETNLALINSEESKTRNMVWAVAAIVIVLIFAVIFLNRKK